MINHRLFFSLKAPKWNGSGVAFIDGNESNVATYGRMYLITKKQFMDVFKQENSYKGKIKIHWRKLKKNKSEVVLPNNYYGKILYLGEYNECPMYSFTCVQDIDEMEKTPVKKEYYDVIKRGLQETYKDRFPDEEIDKYLNEYSRVENDKSGIIFDLDGTLWDTTEITHKSLVKIAKERNLIEVKMEDVKKSFGLNKEECAKIYFPNLKISDAVKLSEIAEKNKLNELSHGNSQLVAFYPNLKDIIKKLHLKYSIFIVSNSAEPEYIKSFLKLSDLENYFDDFIAASNLKISKSQAIIQIIKDYNLKNSVYIGDTETDKISAESAKIPFIYASYGFGNNVKANYKIDNLNELPNIIDEIL